MPLELLTLFPLNRSNKRPVCKWGTLQPPGKPVKPSQNTAMRTGPDNSHGVGVLVIDVDKRSGGLLTLKAIAPFLPRDTAVNRTPGGGVHIFLQYPASIDLRSKNAWLRGIDCKAAGGYVAVPPSWRQGAPGPGPRKVETPRLPYQPLRGDWSDPTSYAHAPQWVLDSLMERTLPVLPGLAGAPGAELPESCVPLHVVNAPDTTIDPHVIHAGYPDGMWEGQAMAVTRSLILAAYQPADFVCDPLPESVPRGCRDSWCQSYAWHMAGKGVPYDQARVLMEDFWQNRIEKTGVDPFTLADALEKIGRAYPPNQPDQPPAAPPSTVTAPVSPQTPPSAEPPRCTPDAVAPAQTQGDNADEGIGGWELPPPDPNAPGRSGGTMTEEEARGRWVLIEAGPRVADLSKPPSLAVYKMEEWKTSAKNLRIGNTGAAERWLRDYNRQTVRDVLYFPGQPRIFPDERGELMYNSYQGNGATLPDSCDPAKIQVFVDHMAYLFPDEDARERMWNWIAYTVQVPEDRVEWMPVLVSEQGVGKGRLYAVLRKLVGGHNAALVQNSHLETPYNDFMDQTTLVLLDDVTKNGKGRQIIDKLSPMITEDVVSVTIKNRPSRDQRVFPNFLAFTNNIDALPIDPNERRYWVHEVDAEPRDSDYYRAFTHWMEKTDGVLHLERWLRDMDLCKFNPKEPPPQTVAREEMSRASKDYYLGLVTDAIEDRTGPFVVDLVNSKVIANFIERNCLGDPPKNLGGEAQRIASQVSKRFRDLPVKVNGVVERVRTVRNVARWKKADNDVIRDTFARALALSLDQPASPHLKQVKK